MCSTVTSSPSSSSGKTLKIRKPRTKETKRRLVWNSRMSASFYAIVCRSGIRSAVPRQVLIDMDYPELTRSNIASKLQKLRHKVMEINGLKSTNELTDAHGQAYFDSIGVTPAPAPVRNQFRAQQKIAEPSHAPSFRLGHVREPTVIVRDPDRMM
ncbi:hypothetical protein J8273_4464 [Carpediemonas membranifera]|uniref:Uncharacterized protein n=1 Tax=Carpediemonas membranifera TaxID=201153 RepID=A0A8J6BY37_9EUKA|nr:hypothetical protein J8273_4464 [Carpediemonas membranifera]|eukprot:KAG9394101.1 hypothetical protein J8273_4464 [Carpediemonas membranifera]